MNLQIDNKKITASNIKQDLIDNKKFKEEEIEIIPKDSDYETIKIGKAEVDIPIKTVTLYFEKGENWDTDEIYAFVWKNEGVVYKEYPGVQSKLVEGTNNIYQYTVPEEYEGQNIIFNNGVNTPYGTKQMMQTDDLKMEKNGYIFRIDDNENSRDVYFQTDWSDTHIFIWNEETGEEDIAWPGRSLNIYRVGLGFNWYKYSLPEKYDHFIFNTPLNQWQTVEFEFVGGNKRYVSNTPPIVAIHSTGHWEKYK